MCDIASLMIGGIPVALSSRDTIFLCIQGFVEIPISFGLLSIGPHFIPSSEVMLFMLIEVVVGPVWVWLGGYGSPPAMTLYGGIVMLTTLLIHR